MPEGRHETGSEETPKVDILTSNKALKQIEQKLRDEEEKRRRAIDLKRLNKLKMKNPKKAIEQTTGVNNLDQLQYNNRMTLPTPQISESELINISKYANGGDDTAFAMPKSKQRNPSSMLIGQYSQREILESVR